VRLVVDTNILISALLAGTSLPAHLIVLWREGRFDLLTSAEQLDELMRVTRYPKIPERLAPAIAGRLIPARRIAQSGDIVTIRTPNPRRSYARACVSFFRGKRPPAPPDHQPSNGSRTRIVSSRSGLVDSSVTGASTSSSMRRTYFTACAGRSAQERAPRVEPAQPSIVS